MMKEYNYNSILDDNDKIQKFIKKDDIIMDESNGDIIIYQTEDGLTKINVKIENETVWLSQQQMAELFSTSRTNIIEHINNIYEEEELNKNSTCQNFRQVRKEGNRNVTREIPFYNLDMIISLGYRVKSKVATNFRKWATERLKEYMIKGFTMDDERLKGNGGGNYWKELLARIKDIRSSEKVLYRQVLDLYATAVDYDPKDEKSIQFFKIVQNKLHYATHGHTASEVIYERADADKPFMGLTTFKGDIPVLSDIVIAKNYLSEEELKVLNNLVSGYFDFAEIQAIRHNPMHMEDYIKHLDMILSSTGEKLLTGAGKIREDEIEVISIGTTFLRFLELADLLKKETVVVTDNDGDIEALEKKYKNYIRLNQKEYVEICYDKETHINQGTLKKNNGNFNYDTLEPCMVRANNLKTLNKILKQDFQTEDELIKYMVNNKTECALEIFESNENINYPIYIEEAIK